MKKISRVTRSKREAQDYYDKLSKWYDLISGKNEHKINMEGLEKLLIKSGEIVLEIGFGTGKIIKEIAELVGPEGMVHGIDISGEMKKRALTRIDEDKLKRVCLICGDAVTLPYDDEFFDSLFMGFTLELFDTSEIPIILTECKRVLKKTGRICIISMSKRKLNLPVKIYEWAHERFPKQIDCRPIYTEDILRNNGFKIVETVDKSIFGLPVEIIITGK